MELEVIEVLETGEYRDGFYGYSIELMSDGSTRLRKFVLASEVVGYTAEYEDGIPF